MSSFIIIFKLSYVSRSAPNWNSKHACWERLLNERKYENKAEF